MPLPSLLQSLLPKSNLIIQVILALSLNISLSTFLPLPTLLLYNIHTYIHPDDATSSSSSTRAAIRRPGSISDPKPRKKNNKFEFDETKAQIFRLRLTDGHLQTRPFFKEFSNLFKTTLISLVSLLLQNYLSGYGENGDNNRGFVSNGDIIPISLGLVTLFRAILSLTRVSLERSASRGSDRQIGVVLGFVGFVLGFVILLEFVPFFDLGLGDLDGFGKFLVALLMGGIMGLLFMPSARNARTFWLGTDQIRCNLSIIYCGWFGRMLLYVNYLVVLFTSLLWINPFADLLIYNHTGKSRTISNVNELVGNLGMKRSDFVNFRFWCLLASGLIQVLALRPNLQMYLNEAVLSWYQRLHGSKVPDLEFSRAKVYLHNHYLCLTVLQFFVPPTMVLLFLGLSHIDGNLFKDFNKQVGLAKQVALLMAWWINVVWALLTSTSLVLYRRGALYVS